MVNLDLRGLTFDRLKILKPRDRNERRGGEEGRRKKRGGEDWISRESGALAIIPRGEIIAVNAEAGGYSVLCMRSELVRRVNETIFLQP